MDEKPKARVAIVTSNYWPEPTGIGQVVTEIAEFIAGEGLHVEVATAMPYYPQWSIYPAYRSRVWHSEVRNNVLIRRATHYATAAPTTLERIAHELSLCVMSLPNIVRAVHNADYVLVISPDLAHAFLGCVIARMAKTPVILYVQDIMPDAAIDMGMLKNKLAVGLARFLANANYRLAHRIYTLSEGMKARIATYPGTANKIEVLPNTIDADELAAGRSEGGEPFRRRFVPEGTFAVVHTGNMGEKQDLFVLLRTAHRLQRYPNIRFYVFGEGAVKEEFVRRIQEMNLDNVLHFPLQERALLSHILYGADLCVISQVASVTDVVVPSKLLTAMGSGASIVALCPPDSETAKLLLESRGGFLLNSGDDAGLADLILALVGRDLDGDAARRNARSFAQLHFTRRAVYGRLPLAAYP